MGSAYSHREILDSMIDYYQIVSSRASFELICAQAQIHFPRADGLARADVRGAEQRTILEGEGRAEGNENVAHPTVKSKSSARNTIPKLNSVEGIAPGASLNFAPAIKVARLDGLRLVDEKNTTHLIRERGQR